MYFEKGSLYRDKNYLEYIRSLPCIITGRTHDVVAHHIRMNLSGGIGIKPSDYRTVPLDPIEHRKLHDKGERSYWNSHKIDALKVVVSQMLVYLNSELYDAQPQIGVRCLEEMLWRLHTINQETDC